jgi:hypothetical protein
MNIHLKVEGKHGKKLAFSSVAKSTAGSITFTQLAATNNLYISRCGRVVKEHIKGQQIGYKELTQCIVKHNKLGAHHDGYWSVTVPGIGRKTIHRLLAETFIPNPNNLPYVDHVNRQSLDNSIQNLRWISAAGNSLNKSKKAGATSKYIGVCKQTNGNRYTARFRQKHLGCFITQEEAALAYNQEAQKYGTTHLNPI